MNQLVEKLLTATTMGLFLLGLEADLEDNKGELTALDKAKAKFIAAYHEMIEAAELDKIERAEMVLAERKSKLLGVIRP